MSFAPNGPPVHEELRVHVLNGMPLQQVQELRHVHIRVHERAIEVVRRKGLQVRQSGSAILLVPRVLDVPTGHGPVGCEGLQVLEVPDEQNGYEDLVAIAYAYCLLLLLVVVAYCYCLLLLPIAIAYCH